MHARPRGPQPRGERHGVAHVVEVPVGHEQQVQLLLRLGRARAVRVAHPGVEQDHLAAGRPDLDRRVAEPGERRVAPDRHRGLLVVCAPRARAPADYRPVDGYTRGRACAADRDDPPPDQLDRPRGARRRVVRGRRRSPGCSRRRRRASSRSPPRARPGSGSSTYLSDAGLPDASRRTAIVTADPAFDVPRRVALAVFVVVAAITTFAIARGGRARVLLVVGMAAGVAALVLGALTWGVTPLGVVAARGPAARPRRGDRRRVRGDDPRPLVPRDARSSPRRRS